MSAAIKPLMLRCAKRRHYLLLEGDRYHRVEHGHLRMRLKERGLAHMCRGRRDRQPRQIVALYGATVKRAIFDAAERGTE